MTSGAKFKNILMFVKQNGYVMYFKKMKAITKKNFCAKFDYTLYIHLPHKMKNFEAKIKCIIKC